jgi:hypothetical protein
MTVRVAEVFVCIFLGLALGLFGCALHATFSL